MKYDSRVDLWIKLLFYTATLLMVFPVFTVPGDEILFYLATTLPIVGITLWILKGSYNKFDEEELIVKLGPFSTKVKYENIKEISTSKNWMSSWALTNKRVAIKVHSKTFFKGNLQIGPMNREEFIDELKRRCRNLD